MENENLEEKEKAIEMSLIEKEREKDKRPFFTKTIEKTLHDIAVFRQRRSKIH